MGIAIQSTPVFTLILGDKLLAHRTIEIPHFHTIFSLLSPLRISGTLDRGYLPALLRSHSGVRPLPGPASRRIQDEDSINPWEKNSCRPGTSSPRRCHHRGTHRRMYDATTNLKDPNGTTVLGYSN